MTLKIEPPRYPLPTLCALIRMDNADIHLCPNVLSWSKIFKSPEHVNRKAFTAHTWYRPFRRRDGVDMTLYSPSSESSASLEVSEGHCLHSEPCFALMAFSKPSSIGGLQGL
jgi:hypothetical protein